MSIILHWVAILVWLPSINLHRVVCAIEPQVEHPQCYYIR